MNSMPDEHNGRRFAIPISRRLSWDLLTFHRSVPLCAHDRHMNLSVLAKARSGASVRISWPAVFLKAYGLVAQETPELRQTWYRWPWNHLYQHPHSVGSITVHRPIGDQAWLFWGQIPAPESLSLQEIQQRINRFAEGDAKSVFKRQYQLAHVPTLLRRAIWWWNLNVAAKSRAKRLGTFFLSTLAGRGAEIQLPPSIHTGCLTFGPLDEVGNCRVTLAYDHRVMDGVLVADCLKHLEAELNGPVTEELRALSANFTSDAHSQAA
jgi:hypothetical protein